MKEILPELQQLEIEIKGLTELNEILSRKERGSSMLTESQVPMAILTLILSFVLSD